MMEGVNPMEDATYPGITYKGREITVPLSEEDRDFLMSRGQDVKVNNLDKIYANHAHRARVLAEAEGEDVVVDEDDSYSEWTVSDLRAELAVRELDTTGKKPELVARLEQNDAEEVAKAANDGAE